MYRSKTADLTYRASTVYISLPYIMAAITSGTDKNEEIMSLTPYA